MSGYPIISSVVFFVFIAIIIGGVTAWDNLNRKIKVRETNIINAILVWEKMISKSEKDGASKDSIKRFQDNLKYYIEGLTDVLGKKKVNNILDKVNLKIEWEYVHLLERRTMQGKNFEALEKMREKFN